MRSIPTSLKPGDTVGICSTARKLSTEEISFATKLIEDWGYRVKLGETIGLVENQFAGSDQARAAELTAFFNDPDVSAILCARGGYGTARLLPYLDPAVLDKHPKWLVGFSDVTALHAWLNQYCETVSLHAAMPITFAENSTEALNRLRACLEGNFEGFAIPAHALNTVGKCQGKLVGGNLSVLHSILATPFDPISEGCILFIEDLDEYLYHIDRMMQHLLLAGKLDQINGLIIGGMTSMNDNTVPFGRNAEEIVHDKLLNLGKTVAFGFPAGHIMDNCPLVLGAEVALSVSDKETSLVYLP